MKREIMSGRTIKTIILALSATLVVVGCAGMASRVPPVDEAQVAAAESKGLNRTTLERGRVIYLRDCGRCHTPVSVSTYDEQGWREILPKMYEKAYLSSQESADLGAYVLTVSRLQDRR